ncbi:Clp protease ClpP [Vibrio sp. JC009]|uniref:ClpP-like prohead protease/major capsid protein fusion protein n=1 Tax=Vibrio sp. JC009 TaxID=2912314 RepID=UPI0023B052D7|nr:ClpP-like prohead protease/major capsid protein fusion protein [Vibrio sp. JC009]WED23070.1 Clp protease ClpP [Vibrio sp. JC009]
MPNANSKPEKSWYTLKNEASNDTAQLYIHGIIGDWDIESIDLIKALQQIGDKDLVARIQSYGGSVYEGLAMYNAIKAHKGKTIGVVDGLAASIATYVLMAFDEIHMPENATFMIHNPTIGAWGEEEEIESALTQVKNAKATVSDAYAERSGKPVEDILEAMSKETWFTANEALEWGLIDEVIDPVNLQNQLNENDVEGIKKFKNVPEALLNQITVQDEPEGETEPEPEPLAANATNSPSIQSKQEQVSDMPKPNEELQNAVKAENERQTAIRALCNQHKVGEELTNEMLNDVDCTVQNASVKILANLGESSVNGQRETETNLTASHIRAGNGNHVKEELQNALNARCGTEELEKDNSFGHESLLNMARASLGENARSAMTKTELVNRAFNSQDFGDIITEGIRTVMRDELKVRAPLWRELANTESLPDFRETELVTVNDAPDLMEIKEDGEYKTVLIKGTGERMQLATFGREIQFTRQAIINDEIGLISKVPRKFMQSAYRLSDKLMFNAILAGKMQDGGDVFIKGTGGKWGNLIDNITKDDHVALIMALHKAFATATTDEGDVLDLRGEVLLANPDHASMFEAVLNTASKPDTFNPAYKKFNRVVETARIASVDGAIGLTSKDFDSVVMGFLDGQQDPWLETGDGWSSDGAKMRITYDIASKVLDRRGLAKGIFKAT